MAELGGNVDLRDDYRRLITGINFGIFSLFILFCAYGLFYLAIHDPSWLVSKKFAFVEPKCPRMGFWRLILPLLIYSGFVYSVFRLFRPHFSGALRGFASDLTALNTRRAGVLFVWLAGLFALLCLNPSFSFMLKNLGASYGHIDTESYHNLVITFLRHDFNSSWEGGLFFFKYCLLTVPTIVVSLFVDSVKAYNIVVLGFIFGTAVNFIVIVLNLLKNKVNSMLACVLVSFGIMGLVNYVTTWIMIPPASSIIRNQDVMTNIISSGFYGGLSAVFLLTSFIVVFSNLLVKRLPAVSAKVQMLLVAGTFSLIACYSYFHILFYLLPMAGLFLAPSLFDLDRTSDRLKLAAAVFLCVLAGAAEFLAIDIMPRYSMNPVAHLRQIAAGIFCVLLVYLAMAQYLRRWLSKAWDYVNTPYVLLVVGAVLYAGLSVGSVKFAANILGKEYLLPIGIERTYLLYVLPYAAVPAFVLFFVLLFLFRGNYLKHMMLLVVSLFLSVFGTVFSQMQHFRYLQKPPDYSDWFGPERRILDQSNEYVFDKEKVRLTYNSYYVDAALWLKKEAPRSIYFWILSKTAGKREYEHSLFSQLIHYPSVGLAITNYAPATKIEDWAVVRLNDGTVVKDYNGFEKNLVKVIKSTKDLELRFKERYIVADVNFKIAEAAAPLLQLVYQNKLYRIYKVIG